MPKDSLFSNIVQNIHQYFIKNQSPTLRPEKSYPYNFAYLPKNLPKGWSGAEMLSQLKCIEPSARVVYLFNHFVDDTYMSGKQAFESFCQEHQLDYSWWDGLANHSRSYHSFNRLTKSFIRHGFRDGPSLFELEAEPIENCPRLRCLTSFLVDDYIRDPWIKAHLEKDKSVDVNGSHLDSMYTLIHHLFSWPHITPHEHSSVVEKVLDSCPESCSDRLIQYVLDTINVAQTRAMFTHIDASHSNLPTTFTYRLWSKDRQYQWHNPLKAMYIDCDSSDITVAFMPTQRRNLDPILLLEDATFHRPFQMFDLSTYDLMVKTHQCLIKTDLSAWPISQDEESYTHAALLCALYGIQAQWDHPLIPPVFQAFSKELHYQMGLKRGYPVQKPQIDEPYSWILESVSTQKSWWIADTPLYKIFPEVKKWLFESIKDHFTAPRIEQAIDLDM